INRKRFDPEGCRRDGVAPTNSRRMNTTCDDRWARRCVGADRGRRPRFVSRPRGDATKRFCKAHNTRLKRTLDIQKVTGIDRGIAMKHVLLSLIVALAFTG